MTTMATNRNRGRTPPRDEAALVGALRAGDEDAFRGLVARHHAALRRLSRLYVPDAVVDGVVQETWAAVVAGIDRFEGRSSLKTWIFRILLNQARKRGPRERRTIPFSAGGHGSDDRSPAVDPDRLVHPELGHNYWPAPPPTWHGDPEGRLLGGELRDVVMKAIAELTDSQREVITLRDVEGWTSTEVCDTLGISAVNQRVLLHRARTSVRDALEVHLHE